MIKQHKSNWTGAVCFDHCPFLLRYSSTQAQTGEISKHVPKFKKMTIGFLGVSGLFLPGEEGQTATLLAQWLSPSSASKGFLKTEAGALSLIHI